MTSLALPTPAGDLNGPIEVTTAVPNKSPMIGFDLTAVGGGKELYDDDPLTCAWRQMPIVALMVETAS